ncbi:MAG: YceI family protein [Bacteroidota bacterium]
MYKIISILAFLMLASSGLEAQIFFTRSGKISFYSDAPVEKIEAVNSSATSVIDTESGKMEFAVLIKGFQFQKSLMQEHFNDNYMESSKFPKAIFKGQLDAPYQVNFKTAGTYTAKVSGQLTIHGVSQPKALDATFVVKEGAIEGNAQFNVSVTDHNIDIPAMMVDRIADTIAVKVEMEYKLLEK